MEKGGLWIFHFEAVSAGILSRYLHEIQNGDNFNININKIKIENSLNYATFHGSHL